MDFIELSQLDLDAPIGPREFGCKVPLTAFQRRFCNHMIEGSQILRSKQGLLTKRMCVSAVRILGPLNTGFLQRSIEAVVQRHESLRTRFLLVDGVPTQHIDPPGHYELQITDLSKLHEAESEAKHLVEEFIELLVDLSTDSVFEGRLWKLSEHEHVLVLMIDHIVSDWVSNAILNREIWTVYQQAEQGGQLSLPDLPLQFADYAVWQQRTYTSWMERHAAYWKEHLADLRPLEIPVDIGLGDTKPSVGATIHFPFGGNLSNSLREAARREGTSLPVLVLAAFSAVMSHWCRQQDLLIPFVSHGRSRRPELESMIGFVAHWLHFRIGMSGDDTLGDLLSCVKQEFSSAFDHQDFDRVPDFVPGYAATTNVSSLHELLFQWRSANRVSPHPRKQQRFAEIRMRPYVVRAPDWPWKFSAIFQDTIAGVFVTVHYWPHLLASDTVAWFGNNVRSVAETLALRPLTRVRSAITHRP